MKTYRVTIQRVINYHVEVEANSVPDAIAKANTALDDEESGPEAWPYDITSENIISTDEVR